MQFVPFVPWSEDCQSYGGGSKFADSEQGQSKGNSKICTHILLTVPNNGESADRK